MAEVDKTAAADAAKSVAAAKPPEPTLEMVGAPGRAFNLRFRDDGAGFGTEGALTVGGQKVWVTSWSDKVIKGVLPEDAQGEIVVTLPSGAVRRGAFSTAKK
jgi:hypothetical protein